MSQKHKIFFIARCVLGTGVSQNIGMIIGEKRAMTKAIEQKIFQDMIFHFFPFCLLSTLVIK